MSRYSEDTQEYRDGVKRRIREKRAADPQWYLWDKARRRARQQELPFNIVPTDIIIPEFCPVLDIAIVVLSSERSNSATVDRIRPRKGYVRGNIQVISHRANLIKNDASFLELFKLMLYLGKATERFDPKQIPAIKKICGVK